MDKKHKTMLAIAFIAVVGIAGLWNVDFSQGYLLVSELLEDPDKYVGHNVNTMGTVKNGTLDVSTSGISFMLEDPEDEAYEVEVVYTGVLPANLAEGAGLTVSGRMVSESRIEANKIVMGCPSKYSE
ncbi:cytochrome c maturation protein CcmE [Methanolobus chelungpuianus]|uniref:Cytochrome c-type biogenesis protein CcmE n=1 Tax=Methanolobus chelungpuianus TaxID=502115 RepID=A0AAE3HAH4_9EURY|nr:cytochrome c maturation protein CcmE [Methanolobus chelungpuianus]MCQ6963011.1 cytochrome c-type biogenesis protein CcmE [Methanolobus chelungpuianus]